MRASTSVMKNELTQTICGRAFKYLTNQENVLEVKDYTGLVAYNLTANTAANRLGTPKKLNQYLSKPIESNSDLKNKALACIIAIETGDELAANYAVSINQVFDALNQRCEKTSDEDWALSNVHGFYLAHLLDRSEELGSAAKNIEKTLINQSYEGFKGKNAKQVYLYYVTVLISNFPILSFQWKKQLCLAIDGLNEDGSTISVSSHKLCRELLDLETKNIDEELLGRQDRNGCFSSSKKNPAGAEEILATAFAYSASTGI